MLCICIFNVSRAVLDLLEVRYIDFVRRKQTMIEIEFFCDPKLSYVLILTFPLKKDELLTTIPFLFLGLVQND